MSDHAVLSPSGASRWMKCTPSARFEMQFADSQSSYAAEGTLAHKLAELLINRKLGKEHLKPYEKKLAFIVADPLYEPEMFDYCEDFAIFVVEQFNAAGKHAKIYTETRLDLTEYIPEGYGTGDVYIISDHQLIFIDFKYGKGVPVVAEKNSQVMVYALGAVQEANLMYEITKVKIVIHQPRIDNISEWEISVAALQAWAENQLRPAAELAWKGEGEFVPGDHCRFCRGKAQCKAMADYQNELARFAFAPAEKLTPEETAEILARAEDFQNWLAAVETFALSEALKGKHWPGFKLVEGRSKRTYSDEETVAIKLRAEGYTDDLIYKKKLLGITEMEKELGKADFNRHLHTLLIKPPGKPTLVPETDKRPAIDSSAAAAIAFKDVIDY